MNHSTSSRSAAPAPLAFHAPQYSAPESPSAESVFSAHYSQDKTMASFPFYSSSPRSYSGSYSEASTVVGDHPLSMRHHSSSSTRPGRKNAHSYCGRHSSEWLFSGWSIFSRKGST